MPHTKVKHLQALLIALSFHTLLNAQITVVPNQTAMALAQKLAGTGVTIANATLNCPGEANGIFDKVLSNLPLDSGIILTSGRSQTAGTAFGANGTYPDFASTSHNLTGEPDLALLSNSTTANIHDACVLEFDFTPAGDTVKFEYIFASEEYNGPHGNFNCSINDVFGFFISGPAITGPFSNNAVNIALIPGTNVFVGVSTVNDGVGAAPGNDCFTNTNGNGPYTQFYTNNIGSTTLVYSGHTHVFKAISAVTPCVPHHLKLAIADASDWSWDSGVFLKAGSLTSPSASISRQYPGPGGLDSTGLNYAVRGCLPGQFTFTRAVAAPLPLVVKYQITGTAQNGIDYQMIPDSVVIPANQTSTTLTIQGLPSTGNPPVGPVTVKLRVLSFACDPTQQKAVDSAELNIYDEFVVQIFNKDTTVCENSVVQLRAMADSLLSFTWTPAEVLNNPNIINPVATIAKHTTFTISANFPNAACPPTTRSFTAFVEPIPLVNILFEDTSLCFKNPLKLPVDVQPDTFMQYTYTWSPTVGLSDPAAMEPSFFPPAPDDYRLTLTVNTPIGCTGEDTVLLIARPGLQLSNVTSDFTVKYGDAFQLTADGALYYAWTPDNLLDYPHVNNPKVTAALHPETFRVIGMNVWGCRDTAYVRMNIDYTMDEILPNAFTPNNDGQNDVFNITKLVFQRLVEFRVYNRWGQEVFSTTDAKKGWDGSYKGGPAEMGVYHYLIRVNTPDGKIKTYKGDVTLLR